MLKGNILKKARMRAGLSQEEVAKILKISRQSISKWENDKARPSLDNLSKLCQTYNISLDHVYEIKLRGDRKSAKNDEKILFLILTGIISFIPFFQIIVPFYIIWCCKKKKILNSTILIANIVIMIYGICTAYNILFSLEMIPIEFFHKKIPIKNISSIS